jgi:hypothetical protein
MGGAAALTTIFFSAVALAAFPLVTARCLEFDAAEFAGVEFAAEEFFPAAGADCVGWATGALTEGWS